MNANRKARLSRLARWKLAVLWQWWHFSRTDTYWHWLARHLPRKLRYWSVVVTGAQVWGALGDKEPGEISLITLLEEGGRAKR